MEKRRFFFKFAHFPVFLIIISHQASLSLKKATQIKDKSTNQHNSLNIELHVGEKNLEVWKIFKKKAF